MFDMHLFLDILKKVKKSLTFIYKHFRKGWTKK